AIRFLRSATTASFAGAFVSEFVDSTSSVVLALNRNDTSTVFPSGRIARSVTASAPPVSAIRRAYSSRASAASSPINTALSAYVTCFMARPYGDDAESRTGVDSAERSRWTAAPQSRVLRLLLLERLL